VTGRTSGRALRLLAGPRARARIARDGLRARDVAAVAAAAGGPKGLVFLPLDAWLFGEWLPRAPRRRLLAGASIGAWRMAAAVHADGPAATRRLGEAYLEGQRYPRAPSPALVARTCGEVVRATIGEARDFVARAHPDHELAVVAARARGPLAGRLRRAAFARAAASNLGGRARLGAHLQRVVFSLNAHPPHGAVWPDDRFDTARVPLSEGNAVDALLASGTIPLLAEPVRDPAQAPAGHYWDGGLVDYHLALRWHRLDGLLLYPHFTPWLTPGWLDKSLPWRRRGPQAHAAWLDDTLLVVPSPAWLARLPGARLPDRRDFHHWGTDHDGRIAAWRRAIAESAALRDEFAGFAERPDPSRLEPLEAGR
jgi:hypothetical protein